VISTGGTKKLLQENGVNVIGISEVTGFPEIMEGRLKTLHPNIHGGLLAVRGNEEHMAQINEHGIQPIDLVVVNLYPFKETISKPDVSAEQARGNIDIGGPCMIRASAKNFIRVASVVDPLDYEMILSRMKANGGSTSLELRYQLAQKAFEHTAVYDRTITDFLGTTSYGDVESCYD